MKREELLEQILPYIGGVANAGRSQIKSGTFYLTVKDRFLVDLESLRKLDGILTAELARTCLKVTAQGLEQEEENIMAIDNKQIAKDVLAAVGGKENVAQVTHCMTRLRFTLKEQGVPDDGKVKEINGVLGVVRSGGQYQVIIGQNVPKVYAEVCQIGGFAVQTAVDENLDGPKEKLTPKKIGGNIMNYVAGSMTPLIPAMMGAGLCKALLAVIGPGMLHLIDDSHNLAILLNLMYDSFFYFLPIIIGFNAAKKLNIPAPLGAYMGGVLIAPAFVNMVTEGTPFDIFGINVTMVNYSQSVVPVLLSVAFMGLAYKFLFKIMPDTVTTIFTPFLTVLISVPVSFIALAPLGTIIANAIGGGIAAFGNATGFFGVAVIGAIWQFLVMTGMHIPVIMAFMVDYFATGVMTGAAVGGQVSCWAGWGVALGAFLRLKSKQERSMAGGFFISGVVGGVNEPTLYGLCMKYRRTFITSAIGGFAGGAYMGITHVAQYVLGSTSNILMLLGYTGGSTMNLVNGCIGCVVALVVSTVLTYFFGFAKDDIKS